MSEDRDRTASEDRWGTWEGARRRKLLLALDATPTERLAWLEEMLELAHSVGALPRSRTEQR